MTPQEPNRNWMRSAKIGGGVAVVAIILGLAGYYAKGRRVSQNQTVEEGGIQIPTEAEGPNVLASLQSDSAKVLDKVTARELVLEELSKKVASLSRSALDLRIPGVHTSGLFVDRIRANEVSDSPVAENPIGPRGNQIRGTSWSVTDRTEPIKQTQWRLWPSFWDRLSHVERAKFKHVKGDFVGDSELEYRTESLFSALAVDHSGALVEASAKLTLSWRRASADSNASDWQIYEFRTDSFDILQSERKLFTEVVASAITDKTQLSRASISQQEKYNINFVRQQGPLPSEYRLFSETHPAVAVVDIDRDGWDDFYLMTQWDRAMFFRNRGDGTFEDVAKELNLDIHGFIESAIFADFDNDGDDDVIIGRSFRPSIYLVNEQGSFVDRSKDLVDGELPKMVSSVSVVDIDNDGLLDVYFSTYWSELVLAADDHERINSMYSPTLAAKIRFGIDAYNGHPFSDRPGPPNVVWRNLGDGRFREDTDSELAVWKNSYQSTWADYDNDGDPDVYVANDYAPNVLLENDGNGSFTDVTDETNSADVGFGMGASWGDYDTDGDQDLYVTNMFTKAGRRIVEGAGSLADDFADAVRGNSLLQNDDGRFRCVSGTEKPSILVENGGWGWGSMFFDADNDGLLDIYAPNGQYTAPDEVAIQADT